jgi:hypothetical protein
MGAKYKSIIGRAESIEFVFGTDSYSDVPAKIDTGAYSSSVWVSSVLEQDGELSFVLFDKSSPAYTGKVIRTKKYQTVSIENSFGHSETRFGVNLTVRFCGKKFKTFFTLSDRSRKIYPVLIGRKLLKNRFIVDTALGHPIADEETEETLGYDGLRDQVRTKKK